MENKKKYLILFIIILFIIVLSSIFVFIRKINSENDNKEKVIYDNFDVSQDLTIDLCINKDSCDLPLPSVYSMISMNTEYEKVKNVIEGINSETKKRYEKTLNSDTSDVSCDLIRNKYKYSYTSTLDYSLYENEKYISIKIIRYNSNLCTGESETENPEAYIYSKKEDKFLDSKTFIEKEKINLEEIIKKYIDYSNDLYNTNYIYENAILEGDKELYFYYQNDGTLCLYYYQKEASSYIGIIVDKFKS